MTDEANNTSPAIDSSETPAQGPAAFSSKLQRDYPSVLAGVLSALLGRNVRATASRLERTVHSAFVAALPDPEAGLALIAAAGESPSSHGLWLEIPPRLAYAMIDILLGGEGKVFVPARAMSAAERLLLHKAVGAVAEALARFWNAASPTLSAAMTFALADARLPAEAAHDVPVLVLSIDLSLAGQQSTIRLCLPQALLPVEAPAGQYDAQDGHAARGPIELTACIETTVSADELHHLQPGDVLATDTPVDGDLTVRAGGIPKFLARLGSSDGKKAIVIKGAIPPKKP